MKTMEMDLKGLNYKSLKELLTAVSNTKNKKGLFSKNIIKTCKPFRYCRDK